MPLPLTKPQALKCITWLKANFRPAFSAAVANSPFTIDTLCAIACQETANVWFNWIGKKTPEEILALCVFDASGDFPGTNRNAFPRNTAAFRVRFGDAFANELIAEANASRKVRGLAPRSWVYKGYGMFQYDLQHVLTNRNFFEQKHWRSMDHCLQKVMAELNSKFLQQGGNMFRTIRSYNGSGPRAQEYANNVVIFMSYSQEVP
ncbi:MAG: hypothetical protein EAY75_08740 [Bacteroidetes bacterium]|nr:MAG: hypothetical protein EAY75_08740 [Bacteroidota bacterium]